MVKQAIDAREAQLAELTLREKAIRWEIERWQNRCDHAEDIERLTSPRATITRCAVCHDTLTENGKRVFRSTDPRHSSPVAITMA